ncbi:MAG: DEAD/DEAH box helicase [Bacillota bacterium]|nr:DEAD/DEAH box helicase [Bacillota bacterium]MDW7682669.1 DEAD/DEAH box helicase [Bacillota bacterium]
MASDCSCPDWANPCKHLAAVYLVLANEIDQDPFILFELRGIRREELIGAAGFQRNVAAKDGFVPVKEVVADPMQEREFTAGGLPERASELRAISSLLADAPLFYRHDNFKKILVNAYEALASAEMEQREVYFPKLKNAGVRLIYGSGGSHLFHAEAFYLGEDAFGYDIADKTAAYAVPVAEDGGLTLRRVKGEVTTARYLLGQLLKTNLITEGTPEMRFLSAAASAALLLARLSLFIPEVVPEGRGKFAVRYRPLANDTQVREVMDTLTAMYPEGLIYRKKDKAVLTGRDGVEEVLSLYLSFMVREYAGCPWDEPLCRAFFIMDTYEASSFSMKQTIKAAADWLAPLTMSVGRYSPVLRVELPQGRQRKFRLWLDVEDREDPLHPPVALGDVFAGKKVFGCPCGEILDGVGRTIAVAGEYCSELKELLDHKGEPLAMSAEELPVFLSRAKGTLSMLGIRIILPKELHSMVSARLVLAAKSRRKNMNYLSLAEMMDFSLEVSLGDERVSKEEFMALTANARGIVRFRDQYLLLDPDEVNRLLGRLNKPLPAMDSAKLLRAGLTGETEDAVFAADETLQNLLDDLHRVEDVSLPRSLQATLRPYQERGFRWLYTNRKRGLGSCLADDMGLGKTLQVIALLLKLKEEGSLENPALVICPTTLLGNWEKECARFAPQLRATVRHGSQREWSVGGVDVVITSYGVARNDKEMMAKVPWSLLVIDEAQNIKNADTAQAKAIKELNAQGYIAMSGTPVENRLDELWSIFHFILPGYLGSRDAFSRRFAVPIEKYRDSKQADTLRKATAPFILRRMKSDKKIIADLPDKIIKNQFCRLTAEQAVLYQQVLQRELSVIENSEGMERRGLILRLLTSLKQICNHPVHYAKKGTPRPMHSGKAQLVFERIAQIVEHGEKALIFTQYREMGEILTEMLASLHNLDIPFFHGGLTRKKREHLVETFQNNPDCPLMIVSLKAGGTGLNLTAATHVVHYDLWWNPAVEDQATDRAYRIGQRSNVTVHRFVTLGTLEEKIDAILTAKKELAEITVSTGETWLTEMTNRELRELFTLTG